MEEKREHELERELEREHKREETTERELEKVHELERELDKELEEEHRTEEKIEQEIEAERHHHHRFFLVFIVNGEDFRIDVDPNSPLRRAVEKALVESGNSGRQDPSQWELRDSAGLLLDMQRNAKELRLDDGARLFLSLRVAAGGCK